MSQAAATTPLNNAVPPAPAVRNVAVAPPKPTKEDGIMYKVRDLLAYVAPRVHELLDGRDIPRKFTFPNAETFIDMPMSMAAKLIGNEGFQVLNERGHEMRVQKIEGSGPNNGVLLAYDEVVAKYSELTVEALQERVKAAGGTIKLGAKKDDLISFLIEASLTVEGKILQDGARSGEAVEDEDRYA